MTVPFVSGLRARPQTMRMAGAGADAWTIRVQLAELWDAVRLEASPATTVVDVKTAALGALEPQSTHHAEFIVKLNGFEVLDEGVSLADAGVQNGSTLLLSYRRRRPVR
jgi:hypothetical protein